MTQLAPLSLAFFSLLLTLIPGEAARIRIAALALPVWGGLAVCFAIAPYELP
jgi:hypothetical protein